MVNQASTWAAYKSLFHKLWFNIVLAIVSLVLAYGFFSWAINNGNLLFWAIAIFLFSLAINRLILGVRYKISH